MGIFIGEELVGFAEMELISPHVGEVELATQEKLYILTVQGPLITKQLDIKNVFAP